MASAAAALRRPSEATTPTILHLQRGISPVYRYMPIRYFYCGRILSGDHQPVVLGVRCPGYRIICNNELVGEGRMAITANAATLRGVILPIHKIYCDVQIFLG